MHKHFKRKRHSKILDRFDMNLVIIDIIIIQKQPPEVKKMLFLEISQN